MIGGTSTHHTRRRRGARASNHMVRLSACLRMPYGPVAVHPKYERTVYRMVAWHKRRLSTSKFHGIHCQVIFCTTISRTSTFLHRASTRDDASLHSFSAFVFIRFLLLLLASSSLFHSHFRLGNTTSARAFAREHISLVIFLFVSVAANYE